MSVRRCAMCEGERPSAALAVTPLGPICTGCIAMSALSLSFNERFATPELGRCVGCWRPTTDAVYQGKLRCCGRRVVLGRCCKAFALEQCKSLGSFAASFAVLHRQVCTQMVLN